MTPAPNDRVNYLLPSAPEMGAPVRVAPGVQWLRVPLPFALNHINLWLLADGAGYTIVDTGIGSNTIRAIWETVLREYLADKPIVKIIVTHHHPDHAGNAQWLAERCGAPVWMTEAEFLKTHAMHGPVGGHEKVVELFRRHGLSPERLALQQIRGNGYTRLVPTVPATFQRMLEGDRLDVDGHLWRVITGYGHTPEHAALYCADLNVLISGDQVLPRITANVSVWAYQPEENPLKRYLESLERFEPLPEDTLVLPSHDLVFHGLHARMRQIRAHHEARLDDVQAACTSARTAAELVPVLFKRALDDHQMMFAMGETIAHLHYLLYQGKIQRQLGADGILRFRAQ